MRKQVCLAVLIGMTLGTMTPFVLAGIIVFSCMLSEPWPAPGSGANIGLGMLWLTLRWTLLFDIPIVVLWVIYFDFFFLRYNDRKSIDHDNSPSDIF